MWSFVVESPGALSSPHPSRCAGSFSLLKING
jgi:hypothetical protein